MTLPLEGRLIGVPVSRDKRTVKNTIDKNSQPFLSGFGTIVEWFIYALVYCY